MNNSIKIVGTIVMGDERPSYFVDLVTDGSWSNLKVFDYADQARKYARAQANNLGLRVYDETLKPA